MPLDQMEQLVEDALTHYGARLTVLSIRDDAELGVNWINSLLESGGKDYGFDPEDPNHITLLLGFLSEATKRHELVAKKQLQFDRMGFVHQLDFTVEAESSWTHRRELED